MLRLTLCLVMLVCVRDFASCSVLCPDGTMCSNANATCCKTQRGYSCCPYPDAVCCSDQAHCCPSGFLCNLSTQRCEKKNQMWMSTGMVRKEAAEKPGHPVPPAAPLQELKNNHVPDQKSSIVFCDSRNFCPSGTTCCRHPRGAWFCCPFSPGRCCLDGIHCCPLGYDCDLTYQFCERQSLRYPFSPKQAPLSIPASLISSMEDKGEFQETPMTVLTEASVDDPEVGVIFCDSKFYCPQGRTCCKGSKGQWGCCP